MSLKAGESLWAIQGDMYGDWRFQVFGDATVDAYRTRKDATNNLRLIRGQRTKENFRVVRLDIKAVCRGRK